MSFKTKILSLILSIILIISCSVITCSASAYTSSTYGNNSYSSSSSSKYSSNSSQSSLLPSTGEAVESAQDQDWNQIMESIQSDSDKDEFTFSEDPDAGSTKSTGKLFWVGILFVVIALLGFWFLIYSNFFSKKCARNQNKLLKSYSNNTNSYKSSTTPTKSNNKKSAPSHMKSKSVPSYGDGYGYSKKSYVPTKNKKVSRDNIDDYAINISSNTNSSSNNKKNNSVTSSNEIYSDSSFSTRELQKDVFWNDFFKKQ